MKRLNATAGRMALESGVRGATDVSGFGFLGHAIEVAEASAVGLELFLGSVPFLGGARRYAADGEIPSGTRDNRRYFGPRVEFDTAIDDTDQVLLFDAQTSGGLLLAVAEERLAGFLTQAILENQPHWAVGRVTGRLASGAQQLGVGHGPGADGPPGNRLPISDKLLTGGRPITTSAPDKPATGTGSPRRARGRRHGGCG
jgi:selenophosphate synthase